MCFDRYIPHFLLSPHNTGWCLLETVISHLYIPKTEFEEGGYCSVALQLHLLVTGNGALPRCPQGSVGCVFICSCQLSQAHEGHPQLRRVDPPSQNMHWEEILKYVRIRAVLVFGRQVNRISSRGLCFLNSLLGGCISFSHNSSSAPTPHLPALHLQGREVRPCLKAHAASFRSAHRWGSQAVSVSPGPVSRCPRWGEVRLCSPHRWFTLPATAAPVSTDSGYFFFQAITYSPPNHDWHSSLHGSSTHQVFGVEFSFFSLTKVYLIRLMVSNATSLRNQTSLGTATSLKNQRLFTKSTHGRSEALPLSLKLRVTLETPKSPPRPAETHSTHPPTQAPKICKQRYLLQGGVNCFKIWIQPQSLNISERTSAETKNILQWL